VIKMLAFRELYAPAHFGNSYEVMAPYEIREILHEACFWGYTGFSDWYDAADLKYPWHVPENEYLLPQALWEQKLSTFRIATELGLRNSLIITPNHVFTNQLAPELLAEKNDDWRIFGQLICPSKPAAREIILDNHREMFAQMHASGIQLDSLCAFAYDYGGCNCDACRLWILTFARLVYDIQQLASDFFPDIGVRMAGWYWDEHDHALFADYCNREHPGWIQALAANIDYGAVEPAENLLLPDGCALQGFVHIGYGNLATPGDTYGTWGPMVAPQRIEATVARLEARQAGGVMAYSEGIGDDVNKAILGGLGTGLFRNAHDAIAAYAERYFGAKREAAQAWARWLTQWGEPFEADVSVARAEFERLAANATPGWRLEQWAARLRIFEAHHAVMSLAAWDKTRLQSAERFFHEQQYLLRGVWGLGPVRQVLNPRFEPPCWLAEYRAATKQSVAGQNKQIPRR
jgi:hypothetical protein